MAGKVVWYFHLFKNLPQFVAIHTVKAFSVVNEAGDVFFGIPLLFLWSLGPYLSSVTWGEHFNCTEVSVFLVCKMGITVSTSSGCFETRSCRILSTTAGMLQVFNKCWIIVLGHYYFNHLVRKKSGTNWTEMDSENHSYFSSLHRHKARWAGIFLSPTASGGHSTGTRHSKMVSFSFLVS